MDQVRVAQRLDPFSPEPLQAESGILQRQGQDRAAIDALRRATARDPNNYLPYALMGTIQMNRLNDYDAATGSFRKAQERNPNATFVSTALAQSLLRQEKFDAARRVYEKLRKEDQISIESLYNLGRIYVREGQPERGRKILREAKELAKVNLASVDRSQKSRREELVESIDLSIADSLVVEGQYDQARQIVEDSKSDQAPAILALLENDPELYRQSVKNGEIY